MKIASFEDYRLLMNSCIEKRIFKYTVYSDLSGNFKNRSISRNDSKQLKYGWATLV
jgi:hypothetical protein